MSLPAKREIESVSLPHVSPPGMLPRKARDSGVASAGAKAPRARGAVRGAKDEKLGDAPGACPASASARVARGAAGDGANGLGPASAAAP